MRGCAVVPSSSPALACSPVLLTLGLNVWLALPIRWREKGNGATLSWTPEPSDMSCSLLLLFSLWGEEYTWAGPSVPKEKRDDRTRDSSAMFSPDQAVPCPLLTHEWALRPVSLPQPTLSRSVCENMLLFRLYVSGWFWSHPNSDHQGCWGLSVLQGMGLLPHWSSSPPKQVGSRLFSIVSVEDTRYLQAWLLFIHLGNLQLP